MEYPFVFIMYTLTMIQNDVNAVIQYYFVKFIFLFKKFIYFLNFYWGIVDL